MTETTKVTTEDSGPKTTTEGTPRAPVADEVDENSDVVTAVGSEEDEDDGQQRLRRRRRRRRRGRGGPPAFVAVTNHAHGTVDDDDVDGTTSTLCDGCVLGGCGCGGGCGSTVIYATDPSAFPIPGLCLRDDFLTEEEEGRVLRILDGDDEEVDDVGGGDGDVDEDDDVDDGFGEGGTRRSSPRPRWRNTGFSSTDGRRRQVHVRDGSDGGGRGGEVEGEASSPPPSQRASSPFESRWGWLLDRLLMTSPPSTPGGCPCGQPQDDKERYRTLRRFRYVDRVEIVADEYRGASRPSPSVFEDRRPLSMSHRGDDHRSSSSPRCHCHHHPRVALVVELSLGNHAVLSLQKPRRRSDDEWTLSARTKILVKRRSALVRSDEFLEDWRCHVSGRGQHPAVRGTDATDDHEGDGSGGGEDGAVAVGGIELPDGMGRLVRDGSYRRVGLRIRFFEENVHDDDDCSCDCGGARGGEAEEVIESGGSSPTAATCVDGKGNGGGEVDDGGGMASSRCNGVAGPRDDAPPATVTPPSPSLPPLRDLLTVVVTTSPIKSNPSTELLEKTFSTFHLAGRDFAFDCRKVIVCDGLRLLDEEDDKEDDEDGGGGGAEGVDGGKEATDDGHRRRRTRRHGHRRVSRKYANAKQSLRNGIATREQAERYEGFKSALRDLCARAQDEAEVEAEDESASSSSAPLDGVDDEGGGGGEKKPSPSTDLTAFRNAVVVELTERHGYGFALREALRHHVTTPYVCVVQHDRTFMRRTPVMEVVRAMMMSGRSGSGGGRNDGVGASSSSSIRYVGMSMRSNLLYRDVFLTKYGREAHRELDSMVLRPRELRLSSDVYGRDGSGPRDMMTSSIGSTKLRKNLRSLSETYFASETFSCHSRWVDEQPADGGGRGDDGHGHDDGLAQLTLTPTLFWYDNTHVAETAHYRDYVFNPRYRNVARGGFVEDKLSPVLLRQVERLGLREAHSNFGCYLLDDHSGTFFTGHLDGGSYVTEGERGAIIAATAASGGGIDGSS